MNWTLVLVAALSFGVGVATGFAILGALAVSSDPYITEQPRVAGPEPDYGAQAFNQMGDWGAALELVKGDDDE